MRRVVSFLALAAVSALDIEDVNPLVIEAEYAVRGAILLRAEEIEKELVKPGHKWPFSKIVRCNIGNPQALGQAPPQFARRVLSKVLSGEAIEGDDEVSRRARHYSAAIQGGVGAYTASQGLKVIRDEVAAFISARDGVDAQAGEIFLTDGASAGVRHIMQLLLRGNADSVLAPAPQYPLYSALTTLMNASLAAYYLDEAKNWAAPVAELARAYAESVAKGKTPRALVLINPGNPTGASLPRPALEAIVHFCERHGIVLLADEVYQENVYGDAPHFTSMRKIVTELGSNVPLVSFHSVSKGFTGECGLRGGYLELHNIDADVKAQLVKLASISLCSNVMGQLAVGLMVKPPTSTSHAFVEYEDERSDKLASLHKRAQKIQHHLALLPGVSCEPAQGSMYLFPSIQLPKRAIHAAAARNMQPDALYCLELLEGTGLVVVPGSGFGQKDGTWHFRTTFLPPEDEINEVVERLEAFHVGFLAKYGGLDATNAEL